MKANQSYDLMISEAQRARITKALQMLDAAEGKPIEDETLESVNLAYLTAMFEDLPNQEAQMPGVLHGFCL